MNESLSQALTAAGLAHDVVRIPGRPHFSNRPGRSGPGLDFVQKHLPPPLAGKAIGASCRFAVSPAKE